MRTHAAYSLAIELLPDGVVWFQFKAWDEGAKCSVKLLTEQSNPVPELTDRDVLLTVLEMVKEYVEANGESPGLFDTHQAVTA